MKNLVITLMTLAAIPCQAGVLKSTLAFGTGALMGYGLSSSSTTQATERPYSVEVQDYIIVFHPNGTPKCRIEKATGKITMYNWQTQSFGKEK